ncbi:hypothetical protein [Microbacterium dauci]|uniref:Uncharacterized protein n=1 Tax=Microbacterium dauci TaxID=3048008 RepID=A0ABT6ZC20_9MICO|nr:hypothetical protein [Microbacterium sp. LX3-4]MDJ1113250.1 hypothetical protein [Microbacterium sp. LX3-4]
MPVVTANVRTILGTTIPASAQLLIWFVPSGSFVGPDRLYPERAVSETPDAEGEISANLAQTTNVLGDAWYRIRIEWFDTHPVLGERIAGRAEVPGKLRVPAAGGSVGELLERPELSGVILRGYGPPPAWLDNVIYIDTSGKKLEVWMPEGALT